MDYQEHPEERSEHLDPMAPPREAPMGEWPPTTQETTETSGSIKEKGQEFAQRTQQQADAQRERTADRLGSMAETMREKQEQLPGGQTTQRAAATAADKMDQAAGYLQQHDMSDIASDLQQFARAHPTESLVAAAALGFLVGRMLRG